MAFLGRKHSRSILNWARFRSTHTGGSGPGRADDRLIKSSSLPARPIGPQRLVERTRRKNDQSIRPSEEIESVLRLSMSIVPSLKIDWIYAGELPDPRSAMRYLVPGAFPFFEMFFVSVPGIRRASILAASVPALEPNFRDIVVLWADVRGLPRVPRQPNPALRLDFRPSSIAQRLRHLMSRVLK
jgi:hypothetical protein